jgi:hypothetical protein
MAVLFPGSGTEFTLKKKNKQKKNKTIALKTEMRTVFKILLAHFKIALDQKQRWFEI